MRLLTLEEWKSIRQKNQEASISAQKEAQILHKIGQFIQRLGLALEKVKQEQIIKAKIIINQFSVQTPFDSFDWLIFSGTALFLACKDDDNVVRLQEIVEKFLLLHEIIQLEDKHEYSGQYDEPSDQQSFIKVETPSEPASARNPLKESERKRLTLAEESATRGEGGIPNLSRKSVSILRS